MTSFSRLNSEFYRIATRKRCGSINVIKIPDLQQTSRERSIPPPLDFDALGGLGGGGGGGQNGLVVSTSSNTDSNPNVTSLAITFATTFGVGNVIIVMMFSFPTANTVTGVTDTLGNTYARQAQYVDAVNFGARVEQWSTTVTTGGASPTVTITMSASTAQVHGICLRCTGISATISLSATGSAASGNSINTSTSNAFSSSPFGDILAVYGGAGSGFTAGSHFIGSQTPQGAFYQKADSGATYPTSPTNYPATETANAGFAELGAVYPHL